MFRFSEAILDYVSNINEMPDTSVTTGMFVRYSIHDYFDKFYNFLLVSWAPFIFAFSLLCRSLYMGKGHVGYILLLFIRTASRFGTSFIFDIHPTPRPSCLAWNPYPPLTTYISTKDVYLKIALFQLISKLKVIQYMIHSTQPGYQQLKKPR